MRYYIALLAIPLLTTPCLAAGDDDAQCTARYAELVNRAAGYSEDAQIKRLIEADLQRAKKEQAEGDADECIEALDHAAQLLANGG